MYIKNCQYSSTMISLADVDFHIMHLSIPEVTLLKIVTEY